MATTAERINEVLKKVSELAAVYRQGGGQTLDAAGVELAVEIANLAGELEGDFVIGDGSANLSCGWVLLSGDGSHGGMR